MPRLYSVVLQGITDGAGALTVNDDGRIQGFLYAVDWIDGTFDDGVDAVISLQETPGGTPRTLLTLTDANNDALYYPRHVVHSEAGAALTGTSGGDRALPVLDGRLRLVVSSGGNAKTGGCIVYYVKE